MELVVAALEPRGSVAIELPVRVSRAERALDLVGGPARVRAACRDEKNHIQLWLRPDDPLSHAVDAVKIPCHKLVLRITRRSPRSLHQHRGIAGESTHTVNDEECVRHTVVGLIRVRWVFNKLADFSMLPAGMPAAVCPGMFKEFSERMQRDAKDKNAFGTTSKPSSSDMLTNLAGAAATADWITNLGSVLLLQPAKFARIDHAQDYSYLLPSSARSKDTVALGTEKAVSAAGSYHVFSADPVPCIPRMASAGLVPATVLADLRGAFKLRPVWLLKALTTYMLQSPGKHLRKQWAPHLPAMAYCVASGHFRRCWIRLGYDPRHDPESRLYEVVDIKIPDAVWKRISNAPIAISEPAANATESSNDDESGDEVRRVAVIDKAGYGASAWGSTPSVGEFLSQRYMQHVIDIVALGLLEVIQDPSVWPGTIPGVHDDCPGDAADFLVIASGRVAHVTSAKVNAAFYLLPARDVCAHSDPTWFSPDLHNVLRIATSICACRHVGDVCPDATDYEFHTTIAGLIKQLQKAKMSLRAT